MSLEPGHASAEPYWSSRRVLAAAVASVVILPLVVLTVRAAEVAVLSRVVADDVREHLERRFPGDVPLASIFNLDGLTIPIEQILPGGPPKDGIPALVEPATTPVPRAAMMRPDERIVGIEMNGEARAYPIRLLNYHEIVNDVLGGVPIALVFCPLCDSVSVVDRRLDGVTLEFGVSGLLHNSNVLLYDRKDTALWSQVGLTAVSGPSAGRSLRHLDGWRLTTFADWRTSHPRSSVATFDTGHRRDYGRNPYAEYLTHQQLIFPVGHRDPRLPPKTPVVGVRHGGRTRAYSVQTLLAEGRDRVRDEIAGGEVVLVHDSSSGRLVVERTPEDAEVVRTFWFAWVAFHPETEVYRPAGGVHPPP